MIELWTDGSGTSEGPAGWAYVLVWKRDDGPPIEREGAGQIAEGTNNRAELTAVIEGLRALRRPCSVIVHTDSEYVMKGFTDGRVERWRERDWITGRGSKRKLVSHRDLWELLAVEVARHDVGWRHVRGHAGVELNERCDRMAGAQRRALVEATA